MEYCYNSRYSIFQLEHDVLKFINSRDEWKRIYKFKRITFGLFFKRKEAIAYKKYMKSMKILENRYTGVVRPEVRDYLVQNHHNNRRNSDPDIVQFRENQLENDGSTIPPNTINCSPRIGYPPCAPSLSPKSANNTNNSLRDLGTPTKNLT